jgi:hypothetical protein
VKLRLPLRVSVPSVLCLGFVGCSLFVRFDPEAQPCSEEKACLDEYVCVEGRCRLRSKVSPFDGGMDDADAGAVLPERAWDSMKWDEGNWN